MPSMKEGKEKDALNNSHARSCFEFLLPQH